ncbi:MAG: FHA domain-containing protein [bacterium]
MDTGQTHSCQKQAEPANIALPYLGTARRLADFSPDDLNELLRAALEASRRHPMYIEISDDDQQCFLFFRQFQIYSAGRIFHGQIEDTTIKEFLLSVNRMGRSRASCYEVNDKILHSLLIVFQKKPTLKLLSTLVDLDQVLDKIEDERKSCIVSASQNEFIAMLRYEKGKVSSLAHENSAATPREKTFRDDFLVKIYTLSIDQPLTINIYEDLLVTYASDAKTVDGGYAGDITDLFLSKPPIVTLVFKGKEIGHWAIDKPLIKIGRTADNDIVVDNLAVSRVHSVIEEDKGSYYVRDCDSLNGTHLNGKRVGRAALRDGDEIQIGKHTLVFRKQIGREVSLHPGLDDFDQTMIMTSEKTAALEKDLRNAIASCPRIVENTPDGGVYKLEEVGLTLGSGEHDDVAISGFLIAKHHAEISRENGYYVIKHINGHRKVTVEGKAVKKRILKNDDIIKIGGNEFVFHE